MAKRRAATRQDGGATDVVGGGEDIGLLSLRGLVDATTSAMNPLTTVRESARLYGEWLKIMAGQSTREVPAKDWRFADPTWREHPVYKRLAQGYLAFCDAIDQVVDDSPDWRKRERARFLTGILTSAMAPTNTLIGNPAALKKAYETGGRSLLRGTQNLVHDIRYNRGMPSQVKRSDFKVGENLAATPGAVVVRTERFELLQTQPTTEKVHEIPTLIIPPPIGKFYFIDLSPGRSFVEYAAAKGFQLFTISWRNPHKEQGDWGIDDYVRSMLEAVDAVCSITGSKKVNISGFCAGGIMTTLMLSYMAAVRDDRVNAAAFGVMLLDFDTEAPIGALQSKRLIGVARKRSHKQGIHPASALATVFTWMRPNDLVWNYWVNNYLTGQDPPSFDILAWSVDGTNLPGKLHGQFLDIFETNALPKKGSIKVLGKPLDLSRIKVQTLVTGGTTDHLTPWKGCYRTTQLLGGPSTFVLSNAGHIASLVNPPGNPKATYWLGPKPGADPEQWLEKATKHTGTWWEVWVDWAGKRSGREKLAPKALGSRQYKVLGKAPGTYVLDEA
jgi:polyhydroxyalkanoate synthase subunit PhaC